MITKDQALHLKHGDIIRRVSADTDYIIQRDIHGSLTKYYTKPVKHKWRVSGKIKLWKTRPNEFKIPIKHGLYDNWYLTHENAHLFTLDKE